MPRSIPGATSGMEKRNMSDLTSRPYRPDAARVCEACVWGRGAHADFCAYSPFETVTLLIPYSPFETVTLLIRPRRKTDNQTAGVKL